MYGVAAVGAVVVGYLAFAVFGVHTLFIDDEVNEDVPVFADDVSCVDADVQLQANTLGCGVARLRARDGSG